MPSVSAEMYMMVGARLKRALGVMTKRTVSMIKQAPI